MTETVQNTCGGCGQCDACQKAEFARLDAEYMAAVIDDVGCGGCGECCECLAASNRERVEYELSLDDSDENTSCSDERMARAHRVVQMANDARAKDVGLSIWD
ncbi:Uncharacterised protein [Mycobacteroides abscessus subsp. abscessus]|nr:Uncharacterised protein [Mycobacteroides abscessus subsp. abscessus]